MTRPACSDERLGRERRSTEQSAGGGTSRRRAARRATPSTAAGRSRSGLAASRARAASEHEVGRQRRRPEEADERERAETDRGAAEGLPHPPHLVRRAVGDRDVLGAAEERLHQPRADGLSARTRVRDEMGAADHAQRAPVEHDATDVRADHPDDRRRRRPRRATEAPGRPTDGRGACSRRTARARGRASSASPRQTSAKSRATAGMSPRSSGRMLRHAAPGVACAIRSVTSSARPVERPDPLEVELVERDLDRELDLDRGEELDECERVEDAAVDQVGVGRRRLDVEDGREERRPGGRRPARSRGAARRASSRPPSPESSSRRRGRSILPFAFFGSSSSSSQRVGSMYRGSVVDELRSELDGRRAHVLRRARMRSRSASPSNPSLSQPTTADSRTASSALQRGLDLAELDPVTAALDLRVDAPEEVEEAVVAEHAPGRRSGTAAARDRADRGRTPRSSSPRPASSRG